MEDRERERRNTEDHDWKVYDLQRLTTLGTGTFARVYLTNNPSTGNYYALKVLKKSVIVRLKQVQHVLNEKETLLKAADCPFVVTLSVIY